MAKWTIDPAHSEIEFRIKHLAIANVKGFFKKYSGEVESEGDDFNNPKITFTADSSSIDTNDEKRDQHLRSAEFFNIEKYPEIKFASTNYTKVQDNEYKLKGDLTILDVTKPIKLDVKFNGIAMDPWGGTRAGFHITGKLNRKDWGLTWNTALEAGGFLLADELKVSCEIELVKQK